MMEQDWVLSVSDLNEYVRRSLAADPMLQGLRLRGEISNFKRHSSGHWYFTLKDAQSRINCVMFRQYNMGVSLRPADGMAVIVSGSVSLYVQGGAYQLYVQAMRPDGLGSLYAQFEERKARLAREGLFGAARYTHGVRQAQSRHSADAAACSGTRGWRGGGNRRGNPSGGKTAGH